MSYTVSSMWFWIQPRFHEWAIFSYIFRHLWAKPYLCLSMLTQISPWLLKNAISWQHICVCDNTVLHTEFSFSLKVDTRHDTLTRQATAIMLTAREKHHLSQVCLHTTLLHLFHLWLCWLSAWPVQSWKRLKVVALSALAVKCIRHRLTSHSESCTSVLVPVV